MKRKIRWLVCCSAAFGLLATNAAGSPINLVCTNANKTIQLVLDQSAGTAGFVNDTAWKAEFTDSTVRWEAEGSTPNANWRSSLELNRNNGFLSVNGSVFGGRVLQPASSSETYRCVVAQKLF